MTMGTLRTLSCVLVFVGFCFLLTPTAAQIVCEGNNRGVLRCDPWEKFRTLSGDCNNLQRPSLGAANTAFRRLLRPDYANGISQPRESSTGGLLPNARSVSLVTFRDEPSEESPRLSHMAMVFGQFLAHDITLAGLPEGVECDGCEQIGECFGIAIKAGDPRFPGVENVECMRLVRDNPCNQRELFGRPRQQENTLSSYIDASHIYGATEGELRNIRDTSFPDRGLLSTMPAEISSIKQLLPRANPHTFCRSPDPVNRPCFDTGDFRRNNENQGLNVMHTIWVREHNRIAKKLHSINSDWSGEQVFQETRKIIGAMMQHITFNEFLRVMLGPQNLQAFRLVLKPQGRHFQGYNSNVNPTIPNAAAAAALRFGHSTIRNDFSRFRRDHSRLPSIDLREFHNPEFLYEVDNGGVDGILRGMSKDSAQNIDRFFSDSVLNNVIPERDEIGDLMSFNIQRGRDHGLPGYNHFREFCSQECTGKAANFEGLADTIRRADIDILRKAYENVDDVDLFVGGIFEKPFNGGGLGAVFTCILGNMFRALRFGDRFWYENGRQGGSSLQPFTLAQLDALRKASLARIICENSDDITQIQPKVLLQSDVDGNSEVSCHSLPIVDLYKWKEAK